LTSFNFSLIKIYLEQYLASPHRNTV